MFLNPSTGKDPQPKIPRHTLIFNVEFNEKLDSVKLPEELQVRSTQSAAHNNRGGFSQMESFLLGICFSQTRNTFGAKKG